MNYFGVLGDTLSDTLRVHIGSPNAFRNEEEVPSCFTCRGHWFECSTATIFLPCIFTRILKICCYLVKRGLHVFIGDEMSVSLNGDVINMVYRRGAFSVSMGEGVVVFFIDRLARWVIAIMASAEREPLQS